MPLTIRDLPTDLRPTERLTYAGSGALNNAELLAIILGSGGPGENAIRLAERLLSTFGTLTKIRQASPEELCQLHNIGPTKAAQIHAALELGLRLIAALHQTRRILQAEDAAAHLMPEMSLLEQEELRVISLDTRNHIINTTSLYRGSVHTAVIRVGEIYRDPIRLNASSIILAHNHPSGDPKPSHEDTHTTRMIHDAGNLLDIQLLDHIIIGHHNFASMKQLGLGIG